MAAIGYPKKSQLRKFRNIFKAYTRQNGQQQPQAIFPDIYEIR